MQVAIVCDGIWVYSGAERVLEQLLLIYPNADIYALVNFLPPSASVFLGGRTIRTSFIQKLPGARRYFRKLFSLWPVAFEQFDLSRYDLVICSHFSAAHGAITGPGQAQIAYTHSPMRYAWDLQHEYLQEAHLNRGLLSPVARALLHRIRLWDSLASQRVDAFAANSAFVAQRIWKYYRRPATVIYPPVDIDRFACFSARQDYYIYFGRLVAYKRVDLLVDAFARLPDRHLIIAGDGPVLPELRRRAPPNVTFRGYVSHQEACALLSSARAFIFPGIEDFGIAPVEAQACGTPVIALRRGGLREIVLGPDTTAPTGLFFDDQTADAVVTAVRDFERISHDIDPQYCRTNAERFSVHRFREEFGHFAAAALTQHHSAMRGGPQGRKEQDLWRPLVAAQDGL